MSKRSRRTKTTSTTTSTSTAKGKLVEHIAALMHKQTGLKVERNVRLSSHRNNRAKTKREIDVLLTGSIAGYPIRLAIECKNEATPIGVEKIDAFIAKLQQVGIPTQHGIYVSASGYTEGAIERALEDGIRPLLLSGLTKDRLSAEVKEAVQSIVYLFLMIEGWKERYFPDTFVNPSHTMPYFYDQDGNMCGHINDLVWHQWKVFGRPPSIIGQHRIELPIPPKWQCRVNGKPTGIAITADVRVVGLILSLTGQTESFALRNASSNKVEKTYIQASFDPTNTNYTVTEVSTEEELAKLLQNCGTFSVATGRIRLPRILEGRMYWPPSERVMNKLLSTAHEDSNGELHFEPKQLNWEELEGTDLRAFWDPIWTEHPAAKRRPR